MNNLDPESRELSPEEISAALDWIDGELSEQGATAFELRMSHDKELARQVEALANVDAFMRRDARSRTGSSNTRRRWIAWTVVAAAALLLIALLPRLFESRATRFEVALAPSYAVAEDWANQQPGLEGASAPGIAVSRGANSKLMSAADFLRASEQAEDLVAKNALGSKAGELEAGWFVVPVELSARSVVIVVGFTDAGAVQLFPTAEPALTDAQARDAATLQPGRHVLPSARAVIGPKPDTLEYRPGFLVPLGAKKMSVLVVVCDVDAGLTALQEIGKMCDFAWSVDQAAERLKMFGIESKRLTVREPK